MYMQCERYSCSGHSGKGRGLGELCWQMIIYSIYPFQTYMYHMRLSPFFTLLKHLGVAQGCYRNVLSMYLLTGFWTINWKIYFLWHIQLMRILMHLPSEIHKGHNLREKNDILINLRQSGRLWHNCTYIKYFFSQLDYLNVSFTHGKVTIT